MRPKNKFVLNSLEIDYPHFYSEAERRDLRFILEQSHETLSLYDGDYTASWLLCPFESNYWITKNRGREEFVNGFWKHTVDINWDIHLANEQLLTSKTYRLLLDLNKKIAFLIRSGIIGEVSAPVTWKAIVSVQLALSRWLVQNKEQYMPAKYGFKLVDQNALVSLFSSIATGGWVEALQIPQSLLIFFYKNACHINCSVEILKNPYDVPLNDRKKITDWLEKNGYFSKVVGAKYLCKHYLSRAKLAVVVELPVGQLRANSKINSFLRQFEPDFQDNSLLTSIYQKTELPSQKTPLGEDVNTRGMAAHSLQFVCSSFSLIFSAHRQIPDLLPSPKLISVVDAQLQNATTTRTSAHHLFIPIDVGLKYLKVAMRFVYSYGDAIIEYVLAMARFNKSGTRSEDYIWNSEIACSEMAHNFLIGTPGNSIPLATSLSISGFHSTLDFNHGRLRTSPTLIELLHVLIGACVVCMALLKPSREDELRNLNRDCLFHGADGYYLRQHFGKRGQQEGEDEGDRPIPFISGKAIQLLQKLGSGLAENYGDISKAADKLFYLPAKTFQGPRLITASTLNGFLDTFCDYAGLEPDSFGRRWYVRIHEMRKWFLLLLFWSGRFDVLDAARWIAGQSDAKHVYAYIEKYFPGETVSKLESECAISRLINLEMQCKDVKQRETGLLHLYQKVLSHFSASSLVMIPEDEWTSYVTSLRESDIFHIVPHSLRNKATGDIEGCTLSFIVSEG